MIARFTQPNADLRLYRSICLLKIKECKCLAPEIVELKREMINTLNGRLFTTYMHYSERFLPHMINQAS